MDTSTHQDDASASPFAETESSPATLTFNFTLPEWAELYALQARYERHHDLFSERELQHLRFLRWLYQTGRLTV